MANIPVARAHMHKPHDSIASKQKQAKTSREFKLGLNYTVRLVVFQNYFVLLLRLFVFFYIHKGVYVVHFRRQIGRTV